MTTNNSRLPASPVAEGESQKLVCNKCGRTVSKVGSIKAGNGCNIGLSDGYRCLGKFEVGSMETGKAADKWDALRKAAEAIDEDGHKWSHSEFINSSARTTAAVWGSDGDAVCMVHDNLGLDITSIDRAKFIALANPAVILELLNELATLSVTEGVDGWIDCKQELPTGENHVVLVYMGSDETINTGFHEDGKWQGDIPDSVDQSVTHWMPLPTAPPSSLDATKGDSE